jgi:hypothetical protein
MRIVMSETSTSVINEPPVRRIPNYEDVVRVRGLMVERWCADNDVSGRSEITPIQWAEIMGLPEWKSPF